jgi:hypothetical protein
MKKPFTAEMYFQLIDLMADAGLENADDFYRTNFGEDGTGHTSLRDFAEVDFNTSAHLKQCCYQDLIDQAATNEWGEGVTLTKAQTIEVLRNMQNDMFNARGCEIMCLEYGHMDDREEPNEGGGMDYEMWAGLDPDDADMLEEDDENYYKTFVLTTSGLDYFETPTHWVVKTQMGNGWENTWQEEDEKGNRVLSTYPTKGRAEYELDWFLNEQAEAVAEGRMEHVYDREDFMVCEEEGAYDNA